MTQHFVTFPLRYDTKPLNDNEVVLLSYFAMHNASQEDMHKIVNCIRNCTDDFSDDKRFYDKLITEGYIKRLSFNYTTHDFAYCISEQHLSTILIWLYKTEEGHAVLDILKDVFKTNTLMQTTAQKCLCFYIQSGYKDVSMASAITSQELPSILPEINNENFLRFFSAIPEDVLLHAVRNITYQAHNNGSIPVKPEILLSIVKNSYSLSPEKRDKCLENIYLYAFLAEGVKPDDSFNPTTIDGLTLKGIMEACAGNWSKSLEAFHQGMVMFNKKVGRTTSSLMLPTIIGNVVHVLAAWRIDNEEGKRLIDTIVRKYERTKNIEIRAAWVIALTLLNRPNYVAELRYLTMSENPLSMQLMAMLTQFTDRKDIISKDYLRQNAPKWLFLRYDNERHEPLSSELHAVAEKAYSGNHMLNGIYRKQRWEYVLERLTENPDSLSSDSSKPSERLGYYLNNIYDNHCEVRMQSVLKSGAWGSGKSISYTNYLSLSDSILSPSDHSIRNAERLQKAFGKRSLNLLNILPEMVGESRLYVGAWAPYTLVTVTQDMPYLIIERSESGFDVKSNIDADFVEHSVIITSRAASSINFVKMTPELRPYFSQLLNLGHFPLEAEGALKKFLESLRGKVEVHSVLVEGGTTLDKVQGSSSIVLQMRPQGKEAYELSVFCRPLAEGSVQVVPGEGTDVIFDTANGKRVCVERNMEQEMENYNRLLDNTGEILLGRGVMQLDAWELLTVIDYVRMHPEDYVMEWPEGHPMRIYNHSSTGSYSGTIKKNANGWFEMEGEVQLNENTKVSVQQLLEMMGSHRSRFIKLNDEEYIALSDRLHKQLMALDAFVSRTRGKLHISPFTAALLDSSVINGQLNFTVDPELKEIRQRIIDASSYTPDVPETLNATLRAYQTEGYHWISRLNHWGAGALLADDMGLGKTVQTIAFLLSKASEGPALVVAPASVAPNWLTEFQKFAPSLHVEMLNFAANRSTCIADAKAGDVIVTTYGLLLSVKDFITKKDWTTAVLDEAHVIKNRGAKTSGVAMQLKTKYRIMLTGTPVQNHLGELWNLFQFVNPGLLGSYEDFNRRFITPIEIGKDKARQKDLDRLVHPFMLRRTKEKVLAELPEKTDIYNIVQLTEEEMAVYEVIRERAEELLMNETEKVSLNTLAELTRLRQASCSAELIEKNWKGKTSKIEALIEALEPIVESGDAALVFSQFTSFLAIVKRELKNAGIPYIYIDGTVSVKERQKLVEQFQNGECPVFIISLKAGGLGLNLTRANYVFHLDPWWNPAIEQQATDRAHRIGQHHPVTVYHFLAANTIEEKIRRMHETKRDLADNILEGTDMSGKITGKELLEMVR